MTGTQNSALKEGKKSNQSSHFIRRKNQSPPCSPEGPGTSLPSSSPTPLLCSLCSNHTFPLLSLSGAHIRTLDRVLPQGFCTCYSFFL